MIEELAAQLGESLAACSARMATAESCTGGLIAAALTSAPGSSAWFERGFVIYSNAAKKESLGVSANTIRNHGAVSEATAEAMARGALGNSRADIAVAVTGIAGPAGGSADKPVGTVCFAWAGAGGCEVETRHFSGDRGAVRRQTVEHALSRMLSLVDELLPRI